MYFICTVKFYWQKELQRQFIFLSHCNKQLTTHREFGKIYIPSYLHGLLLHTKEVFVSAGPVSTCWLLPTGLHNPLWHWASKCKGFCHVYPSRTWQFCLCRTWWWAALPAGRHPMSALCCDTAREWSLLQTRSWSAGAHGISSLCACCCSLGKINKRMTITEYFSKGSERLRWCHSLHLQNHLWRSFKSDTKLDEITAQESSAVQKRRCS